MDAIPTLRDQFAIAALPTFLTHYTEHASLSDKTVPGLVSQKAYEYADAMIAARSTMKGRAMANISSTANGELRLFVRDEEKGYINFSIGNYIVVLTNTEAKELHAQLGQLIPADLQRVTV